MVKKEKSAIGLFYGWIFMSLLVIILLITGGIINYFYPEFYGKSFPTNFLGVWRVIVSTLLIMGFSFGLTLIMFNKIVSIIEEK